MGNATCVDTDGHVLERPEDIRKYLEAPWNERGTPLWPGDQPWDPNLFNGFKMSVNWEGLAPEEQVRRWHTLMDKQDMETAICFPTGSGNIAKNQEVPFQVAATKAANTHFAKEYNALSNRLSCVGVLPMRAPEEAAKELRRAVNELGLKGFEILPTGLPIALGETYYDPIYRAAEEEGVVLGIHGTRNTSRELGAATLSTFAEVHSYAFTAGILLQFTSMVCQGITERFPKLKLAFLEIGATWLPYYLDRLDEHWEKARRPTRCPCSSRSPAMCSGGPICISAWSPASPSWPPPSTTSAATTSSTPPTSRTGTTSSPRTCTISGTTRTCRTR